MSWKRILLLLPVMLLVVSFLLPAVLGIVPERLPQEVVQWAKSHNVTVLERIGQDIYRLSNGEALQIVYAYDQNIFGDSKDGELKVGPGDYSTLHAQASASSTDTSGDYLMVGHGVSYIYRSALFFNTESVPDDAQISAAYVILQTSSPGIMQENRGFDVVIVSGEGIADTGLVAADYGDLRGNTASLGQLDMTTWTAMEQDQDIPLNVGGISAIDVTGLTIFGLRTTREILADAPSDWERIRFYSRDYGSTRGPRLVVTYPIGNVPCGPTDLLAEGQSFPVTTDSTPEFSAVGCHLDAGEQLTDYAIYVDNDEDFSSPLWAGTKTDMTDINIGERCADITYAGSALTWDTTYYWKIKFWDTDDDEGDWSGTYYFHYGEIAPWSVMFIATPISSSKINLTWTQDPSYDQTGIYFKVGSYSASRSDGTRVYIGSGTATNHNGLSAGTTYYYRAWGYDSANETWSGTYMQDFATTLVGTGGEDVDTPPLPTEWWQVPECTAYQSLPIYPVLVSACDSLSLPYVTGCVGLTIFGIIALGLVTAGLVKGARGTAMLIVVAVALAAASVAGLLPMWMMGISVIMVAGLIFIWRRA